MRLRFRRAQLAQVDGRRSGKAIIGEDRPSTNHDTVFDRDGRANIDQGVDLHPVPNAHIIRDVGLFSDNTEFPDARGVPDVDIIPHGGARTDLYAGFDDGSWMDRNCHTLFPILL